MEKMTICLDSHVFISGLYASKSAPGTILDYFVASKIDRLICQKVLGQIIKVLQEKMPNLLPSLHIFLTSCPPTIIKDPSLRETEKWHSLIKQDDAIILEPAGPYMPDFLVTGDKHFFTRKSAKKPD